MQGKFYHAHYTHFKLQPESQDYNIEITGYSGTAGDSMEPHNNKEFTTRDRDNDDNGKVNLAEYQSSAWWYFHGLKSDLNGILGRIVRNRSTSLK